MPRKPTSSVSFKALANPAEAPVRDQDIAATKMLIDLPMAASEDRDAGTGRFLPGNRFWEARSTFGPKPMFTSDGDLWTACVEYFEWVDANPLYSDQLVTFQGKATHEPVAKMRAMTLAGLAFSSISRPRLGGSGKPIVMISPRPSSGLRWCSTRKSSPVPPPIC